MARATITLDEIADLGRAALIDRWASLTGRPAPKLSTKMLRLALAYEVQARTGGSLSRPAQQMLDAAASQKRRVATQLAPGMRLVREWQGTVHVVTVDETGAIHWNGRAWRSLSAIARAITGTRWSGPAFFGLAGRRAA
ncbi:DUF2924 domain-containing protein [Novosphingobium malaysiense]|uniref:Bacteriophage-related protein n=1 Tax=Novosphingobium malaysiense TaxID=1348853 RepID=A0A0B1ZU46_9SPHN|nr:DUF2924 domain-containing protein [Novosphingobium malaysiense]KHK92647.1 hypothetical protein LK12_07775 [Novosphingobium malaysiense]